MCRLYTIKLEITGCADCTPQSYFVDEQNKLLLTLTSVHGQNSQGGLRDNTDNNK